MTTVIQAGNTVTVKVEGEDAYEVAVENGFVGTVEEWLASLQSTVPGPPGPAGVPGTDGDITPELIALQTNVITSATNADASATIARLAALAVGAPVYVSNTEMQAALGAAADQSFAQVFFDDTRGGQRSLYRKVSGQWDYQGALSGATIYDATIAKWHQGGVTGKRIARVGDSITDQFFNGVNPPAFTYPHLTASAELPGVTFTNYGHSGVELASFAAAPGTFTGSISGTTLTVTGTPTGANAPQIGRVIEGPGIRANTYIVSGSGTTWQLSGAAQTIASTTIRNLNFYISEMIIGNLTAPFQLIVFKYGVNDARIGTYANAAAFTANLIIAIKSMRERFPGVPIIAETPNSFLSVDTVGSGFVVPNSSAQAYSDIMRDGYLAIMGLFPDVVVHNTRDVVFSNTALPNSIMMTEQIHPTGLGQTLVFNEEARLFTGKSAAPGAQSADTAAFRPDNALIGFPETFNLAQAKKAELDQGVALAPSQYPLIVLNGDYEIITSGIMSAVAAGAANFGIGVPISTAINVPPAYSQEGANVRPGDVIVQLATSGMGAAIAPLTGASSSNGSNVTAAYTGFGAPSGIIASTTAHWALHARHKYANSALAKTYAQRVKAYPARAVYQTSARTNGSLTIAQTIGGPHPTEWQFRRGDVIVGGEVAYPLQTASFTGSIAGNILTVATGAVVAGQTIDTVAPAAGNGILRDTVIAAFGTGGTTGTGGAGTYQLSKTHAQPVPATGNATMFAVPVMTIATNGIRTVNMPGVDFSALVVNSPIMIFGQGETRDAYNQPLPYRLDLHGVVASQTVRTRPTRYGFYTIEDAYLDTPDATTATTVTVRQFGSGFLDTFAVLTFAPTANRPQIVYSKIAGIVPMCDDVELQHVIVAGGAAVAGLHISYELASL